MTISIADRGPEERPSEERKYLTVLCVDIVGSTRLVSDLDPEVALTRLEPALAAMRSAVRRNGGTVSREQGDGLIALFGAPRASEHHAVQGCLAALEVLREIENLHDSELKVRVGVHSGEVVAHFVENDFTSVYEGAGPVVHLVERLQSTAPPGEIHASAACQALAKGLVAFELSDVTELRGFAGPVSIYRVTGVGVKSRWDVRSAEQLSPLVGRTAEIGLLDRFAAKALANSGQIVSICGDAGTGKSRLAHEVIDRLTRAGWRAIEAECNPLAQNSPHVLLKGLLRKAGVSVGMIEQVLEQNSRPEVPPHLHFWKPALRQVLDQPIPDPSWQALDPFLRRRITAEAACATVLAAINMRPTVLLIEDFHWIDTESAFAVEVLTSTLVGQPLLILLTTRDIERPPAHASIEQVRLAPLDAASAHMLLDWLVGVAGATEELKRQVLRHTGGVPLFIEEVVRQLAEAGSLIGKRGQYTVAPAWRGLSVPNTVQGVIAARIDRSPREAKTVLQIAAAIGPHVSVDLLQIVAGIDDAALDISLEWLGAAGLLLRNSKIREAEYLFPHDLIRDVAYGSMLRPQRRNLHRLIFDCIEATAIEKRIEISETLAYHSYQAQSWHKADHYAHLAARKCLSRSAFVDAARYFDWSIEAVDHRPASSELAGRAIDLRLEARLALASAGETARWAEMSREAERRAGALGDARRKLATAAVHAAAVNFVGTPSEAVAASERAVALAKASGAEGWLGFAEYGLGQAYSLAGCYRQAITVLDGAEERLSLATRDFPVGTTAASLRVLCCMLAAIACVGLGEPDAAASYAQRAADQAAVSDRLYDRIAAGYSHATVRLFHGDFATAGDALADAMALARLYGVRQFVPILGCQIANLHLQAAAAATAREAARSAKSEAEALGHTATAMLASAYLAVAMHLTGDTDDGLAIAQTATSNARQQGFRWIEAQSLLAECRILIAAANGNTGEVTRKIMSALDIATELEAKPQIAYATALLGQLLARDGRTDAAAIAYDRAAGLFVTMKMSRQVESLKRARTTLAAGTSAVQ